MVYLNIGSDLKNTGGIKMKKKILSGVLAFAMLFGMTAALPRNDLTDTNVVSASSDGTKVYKDFKYSESKVLDKTELFLIDYVGKSGTITLPSKINGKTVENLAMGAFTNNKTITNVTIPGSYERLNAWNFQECKNLKELTLLNGVQYLSYFGFQNCTSLKKVTLPNSITFKSMEIASFNNCTSLTEYVVDKTNKNYTTVDGVVYTKDMKTLVRCPSGKTKITVPSTVETIGYAAFFGCTKLEQVILPDSLKKIEDSAFDVCKSLKEINIPEGVTTIERFAFSACTSLQSITIPSSVKSFGDAVFGWEGTDHLKKITIYCYKGSAAEKYAKGNNTYNSFKFNYKLLPPYQRSAGANRYDTAALISQQMYKTSAKTVVLATGLDYKDALIAVPLANAYNAPLLLTAQNQVTNQTEAELKRLKATKVIIVSTNGAVGSKVITALKKYNPTVIEGKTCFETATKVASALQKKTGKAPDTVFFATDSSYADALSASPVAAVKNAPIIYLNNNKIDDKTAAYLKTVKGKVKNAYIIGGYGVISNAMMKKVATALGLKAGSTVQRVAGANRYETCVAVNNKFKSVLTGTGICVAKGLDFPDALAGGVYAAKMKQPLFLADNKLQENQVKYLASKKAKSVTVFGGTGALPGELMLNISKASAA